MKQFLIAVDQVVNVLVGSGWADETLSAWAWRTREKTAAAEWIDRLFFWEKDHCKESFESEVSRRQLPPEYRNKKFEPCPRNNQ